MSPVRSNPSRSAAVSQRLNHDSPTRVGGSVIAAALAGPGLRSHAVAMFVVTEAEAAAIHTAFNRGGELSAAVELRRLFPGVTDNAQARERARTIAGWKPLLTAPRWVRLRGKER